MTVSFASLPGSRVPDARCVTGPAYKVVVTGGPGAGKSAFIGAVSDLADDAGSLGIGPAPAKGLPTVDFGRVAMDAGGTVYLFGAPTVQRWWFMWPDLLHGATAAVVLVDVDRLVDCFPVVEHLTGAGVMFGVAVNRFRSVGLPARGEVRAALNVSAAVPVLTCDARESESVAAVLDQLLPTHVVRRHPMCVPGGAPAASAAALYRSSPVWASGSRISAGRTT